MIQGGMNIRAGITFILFAVTLSAMAAERTEKQAYQVLHSGPELEIRYYPSAILATVYSSASTYRELAYPGFRKLAGYIFGGNASGEKIAMTSPVHMDINDSLSAMSFVMPSSYDMENLPLPDSEAVKLEKTGDEVVAVMTFSGYASDRRIQSYSEKLQKLLVEKQIRYHGRFRYLGYNPPYQIFGRRNEIIVSVEWPESMVNRNK